MFTAPPKNALTANSQKVSPVQENLQPHALRFLLLGGAVIVLLALVTYLYQSKVGNPVAGLEGDVETNVITKPVALLQPRENAPSPKIPQYTPAATSIQLRGQGVQCPKGTNRIIYIDEIPLCCSGPVCNDPN